MRFIEDLQAEAYTINKEKGFTDPTVSIDTKLMLIVGELAEAQNELRQGHSPIEVYYRAETVRESEDVAEVRFAKKPEGFPVEVVDGIIRSLNLLSDLGLDASELIARKMAYNKTRPYKHGGKKF